MASIRKQIQIDAGPADVWDALRDFGAAMERAVAAMRETLGRR